jgi:hypothetical protein
VDDADLLRELEHWDNQERKLRELAREHRPTPEQIRKIAELIVRVRRKRDRLLGLGKL